MKGARSMISHKKPIGREPSHYRIAHSLTIAEHIKSDVKRVSCPLPQSGTDGWSLPGRGSPRADCGTRRYRGCLHVEDHPAGVNGRPAGRVFVEVYMKSCHRAACPICRDDWASREALHATKRIDHFKKLGKPIHVIVSLPRNEFGLAPESMKVKSYKVARMGGFFGGSCVLHLWRDNRFEPHCHLVGYGWIKNTPEIYRGLLPKYRSARGWIVKNAGIRKSVYSTLKYELSHAAIHEEHHTVTWFGALSYKHRAEVENEEKPKCPICGRELVDLGWIGDLGSPEPPKENGRYYLDPLGWFEKDSWNAEPPEAYR